jgi:hypothetical protein
LRDPDTGERLALFDPQTRARGIFLFLDPAMALTAPAGLASWAITRVPRRVERPELNELLHAAW